MHEQIAISLQLLQGDDLYLQRPRDAPDSAIDQIRERRPAERVEPELGDGLQLPLARTQPRQLVIITPLHLASANRGTARVSVSPATVLRERFITGVHLTETYRPTWAPMRPTRISAV